MKRVNIYNLMGAVFGIIGLVLLIAGVAEFIKIKAFVNEAVEVKGKVSKIESSIDSSGKTVYTAYVTYKYNEVEYKNIRLQKYSNSLYTGKSIELYLDKEDFENARFKSVIYNNSVIFAGIGIIFFIIGAVLIFINIRFKNRKRKLKETGIRIYAQVQESFVDTSYTLKGKHPYRLKCVYYDEASGQPVICTSDIIWESPDVYMDKYVSVYADREDRSRYVVDLENIVSDYSH